MGIKGLTDRNLSFPEIGQIRKGAKKTENAPGKDLTYFRVEFDERETIAQKTFTEKYRDQPTEINVLLPFNDIWRCWDAWYEAYVGGRMVARADGEKYLYLVNTQTGAVEVADSEPTRKFKKGEVIGYWTNRKTKAQEKVVCKPVGRLKVVVKELGRMAYLTVMTTSIHDIRNISEQLEGLKAINGGRIAGIPLVLRRRPKFISTPKDDGTSARYKKWMLSIEADPDWVQLMLTQFNRSALPEGGANLLPPGEPAEDEIDGELEVLGDDEDDLGEGDEGGSEENPEPEHEPEPEPAPVKKITRPMDAGQLKTALTKRAAKYHAGKTVTDKQRMLVRSLLSNIFESDDTKRHNFTAHVLDEGSVKKLDAGLVLSLLDWLKPVQDSGGAYMVDAMAEQEAKAAFQDFILASGQEQLFEQTEEF